MSTYSEACNVCQLYTRSNYYKANVLHSYEHLKPEQMEGKFVAIVTSSPEQHGGFHPPETKATQFLFDILKRLTVPYAITSALKCDPQAYYNDKAKLKVAHQCCSVFTWEDVLSLHRQGKLGCVVALGTNAFNTILPDVKLRLDQAKHGIHWIGPADNQIPVLVSNAPNVHFQDYDDGGKDLRPEYMSVFGLANRIATGEYVRPSFNIDYCKTQTWEEVATWLQLNPDYQHATHIVLDVESNINVNIKERCTVFHPATKILCFVIRYVDSGGNSRSVVVRTRDLSKPDVYAWIKYLVLGCGVPKKVGGSNILFDLCHILSCSLPLTVEEPLEFFKALPGIHDYYQWHFLMDQGRIGNGQKDLVLHYFREPDYSVAVRDQLAALKKSGLKNPDYGDLDPDFLEEYCGLDGAWGGELLDLCLADMENEDHELYVPYMAKMDEIEGATLSSLLGIPVDLKHFQAAQQRAEQAISLTSNWLNTHPLVKHVGYEECNTKSPKLMSKLVELTMHYHPEVKAQMRTTPSGLWQVSDETRPILAGLDGWVGDLWRAINENRANRDFISKALDMPLYYATQIYADGISRIHPMWKISKSDFNQQGGEVKEGKSEGTDTSRWASEPNMQNIMNRGDQTKVAEVRRGYIARPGFTLVNSDLKTIEPVLLAWISGSRRMKDIFLLGVHEPNNPLADYYRNLGAHFFKVVDSSITPEKVTKEMRVVAKNDILLALQYGRSPHALSDVLGCTYEEADTLLKQFFYELYPEVHQAYEAVRYAVLYGQMVTTVTGTRQRFPLQQLYNYDRTTDFWTLPYELNKKLNITPHDAHMIRKAWNFVHQGPAAQINNSGLCALHQERKESPFIAKALCPISSVHDAIVSEIRTEDLQDIVNEMVTILYNPERLDDLGFNFGFTKEENPLRGEVKAGTNYYDLVEMEWKIV